MKIIKILQRYKLVAHIPLIKLKLADLLLKYRLRKILPDILWTSCSWFGISSADDPSFLPTVSFCSFTMKVNVGQEFRTPDVSQGYQKVCNEKNPSECMVLQKKQLFSEWSHIISKRITICCGLNVAGEGMTITCSTLPFCVIKQ